jgi:hypothetical protein
MPARKDLPLPLLDTRLFIVAGHNLTGLRSWQQWPAPADICYGNKNDKMVVVSFSEAATVSM